MTKAYTSNLTLEQYELIKPLIPPAKPGGRPREVCMWSILNAIFGSGSQWLQVEGLTRRLPGMANCIYIFS